MFYNGQLQKDSFYNDILELMEWYFHVEIFLRKFLLKQPQTNVILSRLVLDRLKSGFSYINSSFKIFRILFISPKLIRLHLDGS